MVWVRYRHGLAVLCASALAATLGGGCGGEEQRPERERPTATSAAAGGTTHPPATGRQGYDPPLRFDESAAMPLPADPPEALGTNRRLPVTLHDGIAYVGARGALRAVDTASGNVRWTFESKQPGSEGVAPQAPLVVAEGGTPLVVTALPVTVPGSGTTSDHAAVELVVVEAATGTPVRGMQIDVGEARVIAADRQVAVLRAGPESRNPYSAASDSTTHVVDLDAGRVRWERERFLPVALSGGTVVGVLEENLLEQQVAALAVDDGRQRWSAARRSQTLVAQAAGGLIAVSGQPYESNDFFFLLLDGRSGAVRARQSLDRFAGTATCVFDAVSTAVCTWAVHDDVVAFDTTSARKLWSLPDESANRVAPKVTAAWHGGVYGEANGKPVVLDARTGTDKQDDPGIAPQAVDAYAGVVMTPRGVMAYPAIG